MVFLKGVEDTYYLTGKRKDDMMTRKESGKAATFDESDDQ